MGITIVQKSDLTKKKPKAKRGLILSGGALTGAAFKIGGLKALNDYLVNFDIRNFDIFLGISSGSLLATALSGGLSPEEMLKSFDGTSKKFSKLQPWHFYWPNWEEFFQRPVRYCMKATTWLPGFLFNLVAKKNGSKESLKNLLWDFVKHPTLDRYNLLWEMFDESILSDHPFPSLLECLPSGIFDNGPLEKYLRDNIRRNKMTNDFAEAKRRGGKSLYISAMTLDGAKEEVFGYDEKKDVTISKAVQASSAMPGFYKPVEINGKYYVDGGVKHTANIDLMVEKGATLIICYNPFRPYERESFFDALSKKKGKRHPSLTDEGVFAVLNQFFRTMFHTRLHNALKAYENDPDFDGDIILVEPRADDQAFFAMNPFALGHRLHAAQLGFESVRNSIEERFDEIGAVLASYGIEMSRGGVEAEYRKIHGKRVSPFTLQKVLEGKR